MLYFLVYNDNTHNKYLNVLLNSVKQYGKNFEIIIFNKDQIDPIFYEKNKSILNLRRGGGYWLWKPYIINETMKKINEGDIVLYLDSKYYFDKDFTELYEQKLKETDLLIFKNKPSESSNCMNRLCKMDVVLKYDMYDKVFKKNVEEFWAGCIFIKKTENTVKLMEEWLDMCCIYEDITDSPNIYSENVSYFYDHRHDQALLSILLHKNNIQPEILREYLHKQNI